LIKKPEYISRRFLHLSTASLGTGLKMCEEPLKKTMLSLFFPERLQKISPACRTMELETLHVNVVATTTAFAGRSQIKSVRCRPCRAPKSQKMYPLGRFTFCSLYEKLLLIQKGL
jgi:hypothetical protein